MPDILDAQLKRTLSERIRFYNELGIYDFYRREPALANVSEVEDVPIATTLQIQPEQRDLMSPKSQGRSGRTSSNGERFVRSGEPEARIECD